LKETCRSMLRLAAADPKKPPAMAFDLPKKGDWSTLTGAARFTLLRTLCAMAAKLSE